MKRLFYFICTWLVVATGYAQSVRVIDNKGTIKNVDDSVDAWSNNISTNLIELITLSDGISPRIIGTEFIIQDNGFVGIGTATPTEKLDIVNGDVRVADYPSSRDDTGSFAVNNVLYTNADGKILSAPVAVVSVAATSIKHAEYAPTSNFNIITNSLTAGNFFANEISNDGAITWVNSSTLMINEAGIYDLTFNCAFSSFDVRNAPNATLYINGSASRIRAANGYIRDASGHNNSSWNFNYKRRFNIGDTIRIFHQREAGWGTSSVNTSFTSFTITKMGL